MIVLIQEHLKVSFSSHSLSYCVDFCVYFFENLKFVFYSLSSDKFRVFSFVSDHFTEFLILQVADLSRVNQI